MTKAEMLMQLEFGNNSEFTIVTREAFYANLDNIKKSMGIINHNLHYGEVQTYELESPVNDRTISYHNVVVMDMSYYNGPDIDSQCYCMTSSLTEEGMRKFVNMLNGDQYKIPVANEEFD